MAGTVLFRADTIHYRRADGQQFFATFQRNDEGASVEVENPAGHTFYLSHTPTEAELLAEIDDGIYDEADPANATGVTHLGAELAAQIAAKSATHIGW